MAQKSKIIDITQSFVPVDPQAFPETLGLTQQEDDPVKEMNVYAYEGYNFLPTSYGYRAYFGTDTIVSFDALTTPCDKVLAFQSKTYENLLIAFCSDGIYMVKAGSTAWTKIWALPDTWTDSQSYSQYTHTVIENTLYIYRQGAANVLKVKDDSTYELITPDFLNMAGQMGIFKANGSLAFWDSENSIAWSNVFDVTSFTPSVEDLVGSVIFFGVQGRIVHVQDHGEGFVIYCTKSIVGVTYSGTTTSIWDAGVITSESGIAHPGAMTLGTTNQEHFAYTSTGILKIGHYNALSRKYDSAPILPELFDYLRESRSPVYLACHAARFLYFSLVDDSYITGRTSFTDVAVPTLSAPVITIDQTLLDNMAFEGYPLSGKQAFQVIDSFLRDPNADLNPDYEAATYPVPRWVAAAIGSNKRPAMESKGYTVNVQDGSGFYRTYSSGSSAVLNRPNALTIEQFVSEYQTEVEAAVDNSDVGAFNTVLAGAVSHVVQPIPDKQYIQTDLYPGMDIVSPNSYHLSAWEVIYNFLASMDEEAELYDLAIVRARQEAINLNGAISTWDYVSDTPPVITHTSLEPYATWLPQKQYSVDFNLVPQSADVPAAYLEITASYNKYARRSWQGSTSNYAIADAKEENFPDYFVTIAHALTSRTWKIAVYGADRFNTAAAINDFFSNRILRSPRPQDSIDIKTFELRPSLLGGERTKAWLTGNNFVEMEVYIVLQKLRGVQANKGVYETYTYSAPNMLEGSTILYDKILNNYKIATYEEELAPASGFLGLTVPSAASPGELIFYMFEGAVLYRNGTNPHMLEVDEDDELVQSWGQYPILSGGVPSSVHNSVLIPRFRYNTEVVLDAFMEGGISVSQREITEEYEEFYVLRDATFAALEEIWQPEDGISWVHTYGLETSNATTFNILRINLTHLTKEEAWVDVAETYTVTVTQNLNMQLVENVVYDAADASMPKITRALRLTNCGVATYDKEAATLTPLSTLFEPWFRYTWIPDPDDPESEIMGYKYDTDSNAFDDCYKPAVELLSYRHNMDCSYWRFYYNSDTSKIVFAADFMNHKDGLMMQVPMPLGPIPVVEPISCIPVAEDFWETSAESTFVYPGISYTMQNGVPIAGYPTKKGALVFDTQIKRWGKFKGDHRALVEYAPINAVQNAVIPYTNFGMDSGVLLEDGSIRVFSALPSAAYIRYGKIGFYRFGISRFMEVRLHFRTKSTGSIILDASLEGRNPDMYLQQEEAFSDTLQHTMHCDIHAKWLTISIHGQFDLQYIEFRGNITSRR